MSVPKFLSFEELVMDHERLVGEVEELKKQFEGHVHKYQGALSGTQMTTETVKPGGKREYEPGKCMNCGSSVATPGAVICTSCIPPF